MSNLKLREVFTPGGLPSVTYVSRDRLELESKIQDALARGFAFIVITGPTKSGKTVLCKRVLKELPVVTVEGGQVRTEADFWSHIASALSVPVEQTHLQSGGSTVSLSAEGSGGIPGLFSAKGVTVQSQVEQTGVTKKFSSAIIPTVVARLLAKGAPLLVDDFHYINPPIQKSIIQALKSAVFDGLTVLLLAVPHRAFDPVTVEQEVEGRFKHIPIPAWSLEDLLKIPTQGFPVLRAGVDRKTQTRICEDSFGNPLLVQEICSEFCLKNNLREQSPKVRKLKTALLEATYFEMADSKGFPTLENLTRPSKLSRARPLKKMRGGAEEDLYNGLLAAIARLGPKYTTTLHEIRQSYASILDPLENIPRKSDVASALKQISAAAKLRSQGEPSLEWVPEKEELVITDPFLQFYLKWAFRKR